MLHQGGLPGACMPDQPNKLAIRQHKADILQGRIFHGCPLLIHMAYMIQYD